MRYIPGLGCVAALILLAAQSSASASPRAVLSRHVPPAVASRAAQRVGAPEPGARMHLSVSLPLRDEAGLDALLSEIYDPGSAQFRHYLTVAQFTARFGPGAADYQRAAEFFRAAGFRVSAAAPNRFLIGLDGSVADVERVFHVALGDYRDPRTGRIFMAPDREPALDVETSILHVTGLDNEQPPQPRLIREATGPNGVGSGPKGNFLGSDVRAAYYGDGPLTGAGQTLGLMELAGYNLSDVQTYFARFGPPLTVDVEGISTDGAPLNCPAGCSDGEQVLDIDYAVAMAPGLKQVQVYVGFNAEDVLERMASDDTSAQLSSSWGWAHREFPTDDALFKEMAAQGQTLLIASGDNSSLKASDPWPEEDVNLTAVGGTDLKTHHAGGPWSNEKGWSHSAGGPSFDKTILIAPYQAPFVTPSNMASPTRRNVPDIAAVASHFYVCAKGRCEGDWAGTSFSSPIWTGFIALANQKAAAEGRPLVGFLNPALYALAGQKRYAELFHDVTEGVSGLYAAGPVFDLVTGLGSPTGPKLIDALVKGP